MAPTRAKRVVEAFVLVFLAALSVLFLVSSGQYTASASRFPRLVSVALLVCTAIEGVRLFRLRGATLPAVPEGADLQQEQAGWLGKVVRVGALFALFVLLTVETTLPFTALVFVFTAACVYTLGGRGWAGVLLYPALLAIFIQLVFVRMLLLTI